MFSDIASKFSYDSEGSSIHGDTIYPEEMDDMDERVIEWRSQVVLEGNNEAGDCGLPPLSDNEDGAQSASMDPNGDDSAPAIASSFDALFNATTSAFEFENGCLSGTLGNTPLAAVTDYAVRNAGRSSVADCDARSPLLQRSSFEIAPPAHEVCIF